MSRMPRDASGPFEGVKDLRSSLLPQTICFEPLYLCNIRCNYCYIGEALNVHAPSLPPIENTFRVLKEIRDEGVREIYLAGGEPTSHPAFERICRYITDLGFEDRGLVTNGTLLSQKRAQLLRDLGFWVNISFRGPNQEIFDKIARTRNAFHRALRGLRALKDVGITPAIEYDPVPENFDLLYETVGMLRAEGISIREVWLHRIAPYGDAAVGEKLDVEQYRQVFEQAKRVEREFGLSVAFEDSFPLCLIDEGFYSHTTACDCGVTLANVDPFGNLRRCACHPKNLGNILQTPLHELWQEGLRHFRSLDWLDEKCKNCDLIASCGGGCASSSHSAEGYGIDRFAQRFTPIAVSPYVSLHILGS